MLKRIILVLLLCITSALAADDLKYTNTETNSLVKIFSSCDMKVNEMLSVSLDLFSAFALVDDRLFKNELLKSPKPIHADKSFVTLSYRF
ncbi:hypothetical protein JHD50_02135 [Sulfurimonas sp. MAG313]|nr:hypothetical protein [Sulfurimonas sp. MAG313]MDF1880110.1 hypothetical protein [Sulfurimonas sp. MAG313]